MTHLGLTQEKEKEKDRSVGYRRCRAGILDTSSPRRVPMLVDDELSDPEGQRA